MTRRIQSIDALRGIIMILMALDHVRVYFTGYPFQPEDLQYTFPALFFTRWITHFCLPGFFLLSGLSIYLREQSRSKAQMSRYLITRGLWLIALELTVVGVGWAGGPLAFLGVLWALGVSMILMAALIWIDRSTLLWISVLVMAAHNLLDHISGGWVWAILHVHCVTEFPDWLKGALPWVAPYVSVPIIPLVFVMALGYSIGLLYRKSADCRRQTLLTVGLVASALFVDLRLYPLWTGSIHGWMAFLNLEKYPPSGLFLLMTLGPLFAALALLEKVRCPKWLLVFGSAPLLFYVVHIYLIHLGAIFVALFSRQPVAWLFEGAYLEGAPAGYGHGLVFVYAVWALVLIPMYFICRVGLIRHKDVTTT